MINLEIPNRFVSVDEAAHFLNVKKSWIYQNHRLLEIPSYNLGRKLCFKLEELDEWVKKQRI
jgi:excisionase family DNA binding protein